MLQKSPDAAPVAAPANAGAPAPDLAAVLGKARSGRGARRWIIVAVIAVLAVAAGWYALASRTTETALVYATAPVTKGDITVTVTATGTVQPVNQIDISSELSGTVATVEADYNDHVAKGATLATLDTDKLEANLALTKATLTARQADVQQAEATVAQTKADYSRVSQLADRGLSSKADLDSSKAAADRAVAALASANANLNIGQANVTIAQSDLDKAKIVSPVDGVVLNRAVEVGQTVASSLSAPVLFTLADDLAKMQLQVDVDEADVGKVSAGEDANFTVEAYSNRTFPAKISQVRYSPATVEGVVTYKAVLAIDNSDLALRPGMTATAEIIVQQEKDTLLVPNSALRYTPPASATNAASRQRSGGLLGLLMPSPPTGRNGRTTVTQSNEPGERTVYVLRDGAPVAVKVTTGVTDGTRTQIVGGDLKEGDAVITGSRSAS
jgi:HlyD family secretion protein